MLIKTGRDESEQRRLQSLNVPLQYALNLGIYNIANYRWIKRPPPRTKPKSCVMAYIAQCTLMGCEKLIFSWYLDEVDYLRFSEQHPAWRSEDVEKMLLYQIREQFSHALEYKRDEAERQSKEVKIMKQLGVNQLPDPLKVRGNAEKYLLRVDGGV